MAKCSRTASMMKVALLAGKEANSGAEGDAWPGSGRGPAPDVTRPSLDKHREILFDALGHRGQHGLASCVVQMVTQAASQGHELGNGVAHEAGPHHAHLAYFVAVCTMISALFVSGDEYHHHDFQILVAHRDAVMLHPGVEVDAVAFFHHVFFGAVVKVHGALEHEH